MSTPQERELARWLQGELRTLGRSPSTYDADHLLQLSRLFDVDTDTLKRVATLHVQDRARFEKLYQLVKYLHDESSPR